MGPWAGGLGVGGDARLAGDKCPQRLELALQNSSLRRVGQRSGLRSRCHWSPLTAGSNTEFRECQMSSGSGRAPASLGLGLLCRMPFPFPLRSCASRVSTWPAEASAAGKSQPRLSSSLYLASQFQARSSPETSRDKILFRGAGTAFSFVLHCVVFLLWALGRRGW